MWRESIPARDWGHMLDLLTSALVWGSSQVPSPRVLNKFLNALATSRGEARLAGGELTARALSTALTASHYPDFSAGTSPFSLKIATGVPDQEQAVFNFRWREPSAWNPPEVSVQIRDGAFWLEVVSQREGDAPRQALLRLLEQLAQPAADLMDVYDRGKDIRDVISQRQEGGRTVNDYVGAEHVATR